MNLSFQLDQTVVVAGGYISGKLILNVSKPISGENIELYFRGKEYTEVRHEERHRVERHGRIESRTHYRTEYGKHEITRINLQVPNQGSMIRNGHAIVGCHEVPFRFQIPNSIPSSMAADCRSYGHRCKASIQYALRAKLDGSGFLKDYQATQVVEVVAQPRAAVETPHVVPPIDRKVNSGLFAKGEMTFGAKIKSTTLAPGSQPAVQLALVNESRASIQEVKVQLREIITISARGYRETMVNILSEQKYPASHFADNQKLSKDEVKENRRDANHRQRSHQRVLDALNDDNLKHDNMDQWCKLPAVPDNVRETFQGVNIRISHDLRVKIKTKTFTSSPEFDVGVQIVQGRPAQVPLSVNPNYHRADPHLAKEVNAIAL